MLKTLIIATMLLPKLAIAQQSHQLPQPRQPGQWCPVGWMASGSYCVPGSDKAPAAIFKKGWCPAGWRESGSYCTAEVRGLRTQQTLAAIWGSFSYRRSPVGAR